MGDLASGRYPDTDETWAQDGFPVPPDRHGLVKPSGAGNGGLTLTTATLFVYPFVAQVGDIYRFARFIVKTIATATSTHAWVAVYNGVGTGAALLGQTADVTAGWAAGLQALALTPNPANIGTIGTPQGGGSAAVTPNGPAVWGIAIYQVGTTPNVYDGAPGGKQVASALTGQVPMVSTSGAVTATATAPAVLPTMTAAAGGIPYLVLSRQ